MSKTSNRIFDDLAKLMTNAAGAAQGMRREVETMVRNQAERILNDLDVVSREEFDAVRDMAAKAREENARLEARIAELEGGSSGKAAAKPASRRKSAGAAKPSTAKTAAAGKPTARKSATRKPSAKTAGTTGNGGTKSGGESA